VFYLFLFFLSYSVGGKEKNVAFGVPSERHAVVMTEITRWCCFTWASRLAFLLCELAFSCGKTHCLVNFCWEVSETEQHQYACSLIL